MFEEYDSIIVLILGFLAFFFLSTYLFFFILYFAFPTPLTLGFHIPMWLSSFCLLLVLLVARGERWVGWGFFFHCLTLFDTESGLGMIRHGIAAKDMPDMSVSV